MTFIKQKYHRNVGAGSQKDHRRNTLALHNIHSSIIYKHEAVKREEHSRYKYEDISSPKVLFEVPFPFEIAFKFSNTFYGNTLIFVIKNSEISLKISYFRLSMKILGFSNTPSLPLQSHNDPFQ